MEYAYGISRCFLFPYYHALGSDDCFMYAESSESFLFKFETYVEKASSGNSFVFDLSWGKYDFESYLICCRKQSSSSADCNYGYVFVYSLLSDAFVCVC